MYRHFVKPLLFKLSPEKAHRVAFTVLKMPLAATALGELHRLEHPSLVREVFGLRFRNPVGLAAGFDKNAEAYAAMGSLGFGFVEIGTVTPLPQLGNPRPRLFRLPEDAALINRMGFNNLGMTAVAEQLTHRSGDLIIGGNIGKNKQTPNEDAISDYEKCFETLYDVVDYFVVNVSSPNTPNLRDLQNREPLTRLLLRMRELNSRKPREKPILLKIAPDLSIAQLDDIILIVMTVGIDGVIATNTTLSRDGLRTDPVRVIRIGAGGLSGRPLRERSTEVIRYLHHQSGGAIPIIGVGGIHTPEDALEKLAAGAVLVQLYTGLVYQGPALIRDIKRELLKHGSVPTP